MGHLNDKYWYLATPYSKYPGGLDAAWELACIAAAQLVKAGIRVHSPIASSHPIAVFGGIDKLDHTIWLPADEPFMHQAHGLIVLEAESWEISFGMAEEIKHFEAAGKPIIRMTPGEVPAELLPVGACHELAGHDRGEGATIAGLASLRPVPWIRRFSGRRHRRSQAARQERGRGPGRQAQAQGNHVMKHAREDYNRIQDPAGLIPADEPVFLLRGKDRLAAQAVRFYAMLAREAGCLDIARLSDRHARAMEKIGYHRTKLPDLPNSEAPEPPVGNWYWSTNEEFWHGPYGTMEAAMATAFEEEDANGAWLAQMRWQKLSYDLNVAEAFLDRNEEQNFEGDAEIPSYAEWEIEFLTSMLLRGWVAKHGLEKEFRSLVDIPGGTRVWRPRCDLALASITETVYRVPMAREYIDWSMEMRHG